MEESSDRFARVVRFNVMNGVCDGEIVLEYYKIFGLMDEELEKEKGKVRRGGEKKVAGRPSEEDMVFCKAGHMPDHVHSTKT